MYKRKITAIIALMLLIVGFVGYIWHGKGTFAVELRNGITESLEEDFKIKESLGQVFFANNEENSVTASANVTVTSLTVPAKGEYVFCDEMGESTVRVYAKKYSNVVACGDGTVESVEKDRITLRLKDGKLAVYGGVGALKKENDEVKCGETVGYARDNVELSLYENCVLLNAREFFY